MVFVLMKSLFTAALLAVAALGGAASAATVGALQMKQNDWVMLDGISAGDSFTVTPGTTDGSFSYSYAFSTSLCADPWNCMKSSDALNTVLSNYNHNFAEMWSPTRLSSVKVDTLLTAPINALYLYFRVTSGSTSLAKVTANAVTPAAVPLPASGLLVLGGLGLLAALRRRQKAA